MDRLIESMFDCVWMWPLYTGGPCRCWWRGVGRRRGHSWGQAPSGQQSTSGKTLNKKMSFYYLLHYYNYSTWKLQYSLLLSKERRKRWKFCRRPLGDSPLHLSGCSGTNFLLLFGIFFLFAYNNSWSDPKLYFFHILYIKLIDFCAQNYKLTAYLCPNQNQHIRQELKLAQGRKNYFGLRARRKFPLPPERFFPALSMIFVNFFSL